MPLQYNILTLLKPTMPDLYESPLDVIQGLHEAATAHEGFIDAVTAHFASEMNWDQIPSINDKPASYLSAHIHKLVRWRGMIQDSTLGNEVFASTSLDAAGKKWCNLFSDEQRADSEPVMSSLTERTLFVCVDVPGEQKWVKEVRLALFGKGTCKESTAVEQRRRRPCGSVDFR
jgi:hypothetical protein